MEKLYLLLVILIVLYISVFVKLKSMGLSIFKTSFLTMKFPIEVTYIHLFNFIKSDKVFKERIMDLIYPITNLSDSIVRYGNVYVTTEVIELAIKELYAELDDEKREIMIEKLNAEGIIITRKQKEMYSKDNANISISNSSSNYFTKKCLDDLKAY